MKKSFLILLLFSFVAVNAQKIDNDFVTGSWKVVSVDDSPSNPPFSLMVGSFKKATFIFKEDQSCALKTSLQNGFFNMISDVVEVATWSLSEASGRTSILIEDNGKKVLEIFVTLQGEDIFFELGEQGDKAYFMLKVEKL